eukprot:9475567-Pyramimonas_sp.AAC.1
MVGWAPDTAPISPPHSAPAAAYFSRLGRARPGKAAPKMAAVVEDATAVACTLLNSPRNPFVTLAFAFCIFIAVRMPTCTAPTDALDQYSPRYQGRERDLHI